jgi:hypothetical protein
VWAPVPFPGGRIRLVQVALSYPDVSVTYAPTALTEPDARYPNALDQYRAAIARSTDPGAERIVHVSGTPALLSRSSTAIVIEFRLGALSIWISNSGSPPNLDAAAVEGFARSIVDRARASAFPTGWAVGGGLGALVLVGLVLTAWRRTLHAKRLRAR